MKTIFIVLFLMTPAGCGGPSQEPQKAAAPTPPPLPKAPDETATIETLKKLYQAQADFLFRNKRYALSYEELKEGFFIREAPTSAEIGYEIKLRPKADGTGYVVLAIPSLLSPTTRHFYSDQTGVIHVEQGKEATANSPPISQ